MKPKKHLNLTELRKKLSSLFRSIPDWRQPGKIKISIHDALMSGLACMYFQDPSLLQFQKRLQEKRHRNNLQTLFDIQVIPKETQMREILDEIDAEIFRPAFKDYYLKLQRGKHLEAYQLFPGRYYFPIDGSGFYSSENIHCEQCLTKQYGEKHRTYSHQILQGGIMHPDKAQVIPFMPEPIWNDGEGKQDCEINAAKRYIKKIRKEHPQIDLIIGGDSLFSMQPMIEAILAERAHFILSAKPENHKYLTEWINAYKELHTLKYCDEKGSVHLYEWMNHVPLNSREDAIEVNFFRYQLIKRDENNQEKITYINSWVTDFLVSSANIQKMVKAGRCRWKVENEVFNTMKNQGYYLEHNYGHGKKNLCLNFYLLTLLAFFLHQIFELTDSQYQACRKKFGSKKHFWETVRSYTKIIIFETWDSLLAFSLEPSRYEVTLGASP